MKRKTGSRQRPAEQFITVLKSQGNSDLDRFITTEVTQALKKESKTQQLSQDKMDELWSILQRIFESHRENIFSSESNLPESDENDPPSEANSTSTSHELDLQLQNQDKSFMFVGAIVKKMQEIVSEEDPYVPPSMVQIMTSLQSFLMPINVKIEQKIKNNIVLLIELWWKSKLEIKASMCLLAFTFLLTRTSETASNVLKSDITRVWNMRESLLKLQLNSVGCKGLLKTLTNLPANKHYLKSKDGCSFIAFLFTINDLLTINLHETVKRVLPTAKRADAESYGLIYTTAWTKALPKMRSVIEEVCVQNFMLHIFTIQRQGQEMSRLGQHLFIILGHFHHYSVHPLMRKMLADQYEPLLWRFLSSSNNLHRCNAAQVFFSAYPLRCSGAGAQARAMYEEKQHSAIGNLLTDSCHIVRIIATKEVFTIMEQYWQSLPPECIQKWMKIIVSELAVDSSCPDIRKHVFYGFDRLLDNVHSHDYVRELLPNLRMMIHDVNEKVRLAFINLLIKLRICGMSYWTFVSLRHLTARLEVEHSVVGEQIVKLLFDGFYGSNKTVDQKIRRLMSLFILNPGAGRNFFYYSKPTMSPADAADLIVIILQSLKLFVKTCLEQDKTLESSMCSVTESPSVQEPKKGRVEDKENINTGNVPTSNSKKTSNIYNIVSLENPVVLHGFLDVVGILWTIHITDLTAEQIRQLQRLCTECMPSFMSFFKGSEFYSSVLFLASLVPSKVHAQNFHITSLFLSQLKQLTPDDNEDSYMALVQPLCAWDRGGDLIELVQECLVEALTSNATSQQMNRTVRKRVTFRMSHEFTPESTLQILSAMFGYQPNQIKVLNKNYDNLLELWTEMARIKELVGERVKQQAPLESHLLNDVFLQSCLLRYAKLIPILNKDGSDFNCCQEYMDLLDWAKETLIPQVALELPSTNSTAGVPLVVAMLRDLNCVGFHMLMLGITEPRFCMRLAAYSKALINTGCGLMFVYSVARVTGQLVDICKMSNETKDPIKLLRVVIPSLLAAILAVFQQHNYPQSCISTHVENFAYVKSLIADVLATIQKFYGLSSKLLDCIIEKGADAVISIYTHFLQEAENSNTVEKVRDLPYMASQLVAIFISNPSIKQVFIKTLEGRMAVLDKDDVSLNAMDSLLQIVKRESDVTGNRRKTQNVLPENSNEAKLSRGTYQNVTSDDSNGSSVVA